jgi:flagellin-like hook-associated protein FlgL
MNAGSILKVFEDGAEGCDQDARIENYAQSNSVIGDANIATESAKLAKNQILQNFSTSVYQQSSNFDQNMILNIYQNL